MMELTTFSSNNNSNHQQCVDIPHSISAADILYGTVLYLEMIPIIVGNMLTIFAVLKFKGEQLTPSDVLVASLSVCDLLVGVGAAPLESAIYLSRTAACNIYVCMARYVVINTTTGASLSHLIVISVERYICILHPFKYTKIVTVQRTKIMMIFIWLFCTALTVTTLNSYISKALLNGKMCDPVSDKVFVLTSLPGCFVSILITSIFYVRTLLVIRKQRRLISAQVSSVIGNADNNHQSNSSKKSYIMALVFVLFVLFWLPILVLLTYSLFHDVLDTALGALQVASAFSVANSAVNPIVYGIFSKKFRKAQRHIK